MAGQYSRSMEWTISSHLAIDSQEARRVMERARMDREPKFLFSTAGSAVKVAGAKWKD
jgi:hypothetical protein